MKSWRPISCATRYVSPYAALVPYGVSGVLKNSGLDASGSGDGRWDEQPRATNASKIIGKIALIRKTNAPAQARRDKDVRHATGTQSRRCLKQRG